MSAAAVRTWPVGQFTCTLTVQRPRAGAVVTCTVEWSPRVPQALAPDEVTAYRAGRNRALAEVSAELGLSAAVLEV